MTDATILEFKPRPEAPVQRLSSLRKPSPEAMALANAAMDLARGDSSEMALRVKRGAREARAAYETNLQAVDPDIRSEWATRIREAVRALEAIGAEVKRAGVLPSSNALADHAGLLEAEAARLDPIADLPGGA